MTVFRVTKHNGQCYGLSHFACRERQHHVINTQTADSCLRGRKTKHLTDTQAKNEVLPAL